MRVADIPSEFELVSDSQRVHKVLRDLQIHTCQPNDYGCLFVRHEGTEIAEVLGCEGAVPYIDRCVDRLYPPETGEWAADACTSP